MKKIVTTMIVAFLIISMIFMTVSTTTTAAIPDYTQIDIANAPNYEIKIADTSERLMLQSMQAEANAYSEIGEAKWWVVLDNYTGNYYFELFILRAASENTEIWVQEDLAWPDGDPRPTPTITDEQIQYLLNEFDNNIYPTDVEYFGVPNFHDGNNAYLPTQMEELEADYYAEEGGKNVILVSNIIDENYYDYTYPHYYAGFYSPVFEFYFDRNIISIDAYEWEERIGPDVDHPYDYEGIIAHEYQHLIHDDWNPTDDLFMNEGCSMYAEYLCGYGIEPNYINSYFYTPDNSLTVWGDQGDINILADYGAAALWTMYLTDHYGGAATISYFVQSGIGGIDGINNALSHFKYKQSFDDIFHDWRVANLLREKKGPYSYTSIDLNTPEIDPIHTNNVNGFPIPWTSSSSFGNTITMLGSDTGVSEIYGYGSDYITFTNWNSPGFIGFDGDDIAVTQGWTITADGWWSGTGINFQNVLITGIATVSPSDPTLTIETKYDIESNWDFGFVQISTDNGYTWTSLANAYTTTDCDPNALPDIIANLPGLTGYNPDWDYWTTMNFDLTAYSGQTVMIGFRYMTDWVWTLEGWWIKTAAVGGTPLTLEPAYPKASYQVTAVMKISVARMVKYMPLDLKLDPEGWTGETKRLFAKNPIKIVLIVSPTMEQGNICYQFRVYEK
jgi:hypothetical protein